MPNIENQDTIDLTEKSKHMQNNIQLKMALTRPLPEWRPILAQECQVYVLGENYIGKRFDQINFKYCEEHEAIQIVTNNIYALLRTKYFPQASEEADERIQKIVRSFTANLATTLLKISLVDDPDMTKVSFLPSSCIAFRNGVYDFEANKWLFQYKVIKMPQIGNKMYLYPADYLIMWYLNFDFDPLPFKLSDMSLEELVKIFKKMCKHKETENLCFELMYNIAHDSFDLFNIDRFMHLCEIMGYTLLQSFSQAFVMLIGSGGNGKNSLFDGCFSNYVIPSPTSNSLEDIEKDRFITGALENKAHNIFLETSASTHTESKMLKQITGSMYQTIESKGVSKYSGMINCKFIFSGNDQDNIKFSDNTTGFRRRINLFEIFYNWDPAKRFLKRGDYYDTTFSEDLHELKNDKSNVTAFCYFGMYGIMNATKNFKQTFKFTQNDWKLKYSDVDMDIKDLIESTSRSKIVNWMKARAMKDKDMLTLFYDVNSVRLCNSDILTSLGYNDIKGLITMLEDDEAASAFFAENDVFISTKTLLHILGDQRSTMAFNSALKKIYHLSNANFKPIYNNTMYLKCTFNNDKLKVVEN